MAKTLMSVAFFYLNVLAMSICYCHIPGLEGWSAHDQSLLADERILKYVLNPIEYHHVPEYITRPGKVEHQYSFQKSVVYPHFEASNSHQEILAANHPVQEHSEELLHGHVHQLDHENHGHYQKEYEELYHGHVHQSDHESQGQEYNHHEDDHHNKKNVHYKFEYAVNDHKTGDVKSQREERKGDVVRGHYSVLEEDGNVRTVKYYADWKTGFHAEVHNSKPR